MQNKKETTKESKKNKKEKKLVLLDSHAILHRSFHALPKFTSPSGEPTGALYGFIAFLLKMIREIEPDYIAACFDLPEPTFRHEAYEGYKAKRPKTDDLLVSQLKRSYDVLDSLNIPVYSSPGFEADDILGTIAEETKNTPGLTTVIASGDLDTLQLVLNDKVVVYTLRKGIKDTIIYNEDAVVERFGFAPKFLVDFKGLRGDPSDNIIGVPGIGDKGAKDILQKFGTIEGVYKALKEDKKSVEEKGLRPRVINLLEEHEEEALFSKELAKIRRDAPIKFSLEKGDWKKNLDLEKARTLFTQLGFRTLTERLVSLVEDMLE